MVSFVKEMVYLNDDYSVQDYRDLCVNKVSVKFSINNWTLKLKIKLRYKQSWALSVFLNFFNNKKWFFAFLIKLIWLGVGFLNGKGAEIGY